MTVAVPAIIAVAVWDGRSVASDSMTLYPQQKDLHLYSFVTIMLGNDASHGQLTLPLGELGGASQVGQVAACFKAGSNLLHARLQTQTLSPMQSTCIIIRDAAVHATARPASAGPKVLI